MDEHTAWLGNVVVNYWTEWLVAHDIPVDKLDPHIFRRWVLRMEEVVGEEMQYAIPEEWHDLAEGLTDNDYSNLGELPHEHDEDD